MKVIDLLNKIANGEEVPKKIKYQGVVFTLEIETYYAPNTMYSLRDYIKLKGKELNDEVEIIEEDNKIKKLYATIEYNPTGNHTTSNVPNNEQLMFKINEVIDKIKKMEE